jgi:hypothetical protein
MSDEGTDREPILEPYIPENPLVAVAWMAALKFALGNKDILRAFREETGNAWRPATRPVERMIDEATGAEADFFREFAAWFNHNVWGE